MLTCEWGLDIPVQQLYDLLPVVSRRYASLTGFPVNRRKAMYDKDNTVISIGKYILCPHFHQLSVRYMGFGIVSQNIFMNSC